MTGVLSVPSNLRSSVADVRDGTAQVRRVPAGTASSSHRPQQLAEAGQHPVGSVRVERLVGFGGIAALLQLAQVRAEVIEAFAHQEVPFEKVVEEVRPDQGRSQAPLFQVLFTVDHQSAAQDRAFQLPGLRMKVLKSRASSAKFDLSLFAFAEERLGFAIEYRSDLFERGTIEWMAGHLRRLLEGIVSAPESRLSQLPLLTEEERRQLCRPCHRPCHEW